MCICKVSALISTGFPQATVWKSLIDASKNVFRVLFTVRVKVEYLGFIKNMLNKRAEEFELSDGASLQELLGRLSNHYGAPFKKEVFEPGLKDMKTGFVVTVNGVLMGQLDGVETMLRNGDHVILMSLMSGG
jgi:molybdopterin converting factor small subunit